MSLHLELLTEDHELSPFDSGSEAEDTWLRKHALSAQRAHSSRTYVLVDDAEEGEVIGYFSLASASVDRSNPPAALVEDQPRYPVGAVLLTRLAVARHRQRSKARVGTRLLAMAVRKALDVQALAGAVLLVVDARSAEAAIWYRRYGFEAAPFKQSGDFPLRLYVRLADVRATFEI